MAHKHPDIPNPNMTIKSKTSIFRETYIYIILDLYPKYFKIHIFRSISLIQHFSIYKKNLSNRGQDPGKNWRSHWNDFEGRLVKCLTT